MASGDEVAVIGMACRFPGAADWRQYLNNLRSGRDCIRRNDELARHPSTNLQRAVGVLDDIDCFDNELFGVSARDALFLDPQHRLFMENVWTCLEDGGYGDLSRYGGEISVYAASWVSGYPLLLRPHLHGPADEFHALTSTGVDYLPSYVAYRLGLRGEAIAVQTACSSSLVAIHLACESLRAGRSDMAIAGGVSVESLPQAGYVYQNGMIMAPDGVCRPYDTRANGTVRGYGLGTVLLKLLDSAQEDGDHIYAVIRGTAVNNDGREKVSYTAPGMTGQEEVIATALAVANVDPESIGYVEGHGTGTALGDPIEVAALTRAFNVDKRHYCTLGSVKGSIGHLVEAAGVAGFIKAVLSVHLGELFPTVHFDTVNPKLDLAATPFKISAQACLWESNGPRRAAVSSFGIGGTNAHAIIEQAPVPKRAAFGAIPVVVYLSAPSAERLMLARDALASFIEHNPHASLRDIAHTLAVGRKRFSHAWSVRVASLADLLAQLRAPDKTRGDDDVRPDCIAGAKRMSLPTLPFEAHRFWPTATQARPIAAPMGWIGALGTTRADDTPVLLLDASSDAALRKRARRAALSMQHDTSGLRAVSLLAGDGKARLGVAGSEAPSLRRALNAFADGRKEPSIVSTQDASRTKLAWVFGGQGGQWQGMGSDLFHTQPVFAQTVRRVDEALRALGGPSVIEELQRAPTKTRLEQFSVAQTLICAVQMALADWWRAMGVTPFCIVGNSMGEVAAAYCAGALSLEDAVAVIHHRSRLVEEGGVCTGDDATALVGMSAAQATEQMPKALFVVGSNSPRSCAVAGPKGVLETWLALLEARGTYIRRMRVALAPHSPRMEPLVAPLRASLAHIIPQSSGTLFYSTVHAEPISTDKLDAAYWGRNLRQPFLFHETYQRMLADGVNVFLEVGPHPVLSQAMVEGDANVVTVPSLLRDKPSEPTLLRAAATLFGAGCDVDVPALLAPNAGSAVAAAQTPEDALRALVAEILCVPVENLTGEMSLVELGMESVTAVTLVTRLESTYERPLTVPQLLALGTIDALMRYILSNVEAPTASAFVPLRQAQQAPRDVLLFPGAGGTPLMLAPWVANNLLTSAQAWGHHAPGHGNDPSPLLHDLNAVVHRALQALPEQAHPRIIVGHSVGTVTAYLVACALERAGNPPAAVILGHGAPPHVWPARRLSQDPEFERVFGALYERWNIIGLSRERFLETVRVDIEAAEHHRAEPVYKLQAPTYVLASRADERLPFDTVAEWAQYLSTMHFVEVVGGHFDFTEHPDNLATLKRIYRDIGALG